MKIFLDANILFSAAKSDGAVGELLRLLRRAGHDCWADAFVVAEAQRNLVAKGPAALSELDALLAHVRVAPAQAGIESRAEVAWLPAKDRPVLAAAFALACDVLVTADRTHFGRGHGRSCAGVTIHSPRSLADDLL